MDLRKIPCLHIGATIGSNYIPLSIFGIIKYFQFFFARLNINEKDIGRKPGEISLKSIAEIISLFNYKFLFII